MNYPLQNTALVLVDPFNDFLSERGKLFSATRETVEAIGLVKNLKTLLNAVRQKKIKVIYSPHQYESKNPIENWDKGSNNLIKYTLV